MVNFNQKIGPYTLIQRLGEGGCGEVWLANWETALLTRPVAVKLPKSSDIYEKMLKEEAISWLQAIGHDNIHTFIEANKYGEHIVIVSEYASEGSLGKLLDEKKKLGLAETIEIAKGILSGLGHLHGKKIIHRDLKPDNILMQNGKPKLTDFGLSRVIREQSKVNTMLRGSFPYIAPESFDSEIDAAEFSPRTDIWAVGVMLYEMLIGERPYPQNNQPALLKAIVMDPVPDLPDFVPDWMRKIIVKTLEKEPKKRYQNTDEMYKDLTVNSVELSDRENKFPATQKVDSDTYLIQGASFFDNGEYEQATLKFSLAIKANPANIAAHYQLAKSLLNQKKFDEAILVIEGALKLNSNNPLLYSTRGIAYRNLGKYKLAIADYSEAIRLNPSDPATYNNRGIAYRNLGRYEDAIADYSKAIELNPFDPTSYNNRGVSHKALGNPVQAKQDYLKALELNPNYVAAYENLQKLTLS